MNLAGILRSKLRNALIVVEALMERDRVVVSYVLSMSATDAQLINLEARTSNLSTCDVIRKFI